MDYQYKPKTDDRYEVLAYQVYQILVRLAKCQQTIFYKDLSRMINVHWNAELSKWTLGRVMAMCEAEGLPHINALCVNQETGQASYFKDAEQSARHQALSWKHDKWETDPSKLDFSRPSSCPS